MIILGLNAYHAEASAVLVIDGRLVAAAEEERFIRVKHAAGFPTEAVRFCLSTGKVRPQDLDVIAVAGHPWAHWSQRVFSALRLGVARAGFRDRMANRFRRASVRDAVAAALDVDPRELRAVCRTVEHHRAHMASSFYVSGAEEAAVLSLDGLGDFVSAMWGIGRDRQLAVDGAVFFPHSLGFLYTAGTQYLGFLQWGDEYKVMGLAAHGRPVYLEAMRQLVRLGDGMRYSLSAAEFTAFHQWVPMQWDSGAPTLGLMSRNRPAMFFPYPESHGHRAYYARVECSPCDRDLCGDLRCLERLTVEGAWQLLSKMLARRAPEPSAELC